MTFSGTALLCFTLHQILLGYGKQINKDETSGHVASMEEIGKAYKILVKKPEGKR
jgi:hypothetical protein